VEVVVAVSLGRKVISGAFASQVVVLATIRERLSGSTGENPRAGLRYGGRW